MRVVDFFMIALIGLSVGCGISFISPAGSGVTTGTAEDAPEEASQCSDNVAPVDGICSDEFRIFVSATETNGDLASYPGATDGLNGGDLLCNADAQAAGLQKTYKAILSANIGNAFTRISAEGKIYIFTSDGERILVANTESDLWNTSSANLLSEINRNPSGEFESSNVWTGTTEAGLTDSDRCSNWATDSMVSVGTVGMIGSLDSDWIKRVNAQCSETANIYCISQ